ncbi:shufflon system plasmid conjugative transfer pilus tip adhesin PilV [Enterobacter hormaechei]|nr:shufflon system plasmid conjugative transfer pilus tip adhesin PilV [Enterobacter hormaechei]
MTSSAPSPVNGGMTLTSTAMVMAIVLIAAPLGYMRYAEYMNERTWDVMALHMDTFTRAARHYVRDHYASLVGQVSHGNPVTIGGQALRDQGYLPAGFSLTNFNTQRYQVSIARDPQKTSQLAAFVMTTGGQPIAFKGLRYIAQSLSGMGGYLYPDDIATGADGGWQLKLTDYSLRGQSGHLVDWLSADVLGGSDDESDRLYRFQVNGRPDLNRMHTDIDMGSNAINNAGTVTASSDIKTTGGWIVTHDSKGWMNETHGGGFYMDDDSWVKSVNNKGISTGGQMKGGTVRADGRLSGGEFLQLDSVVSTGASCDRNGLLSFDALGIPQSCQSKKWQPVGSAGSISRAATNNLTFTSPGIYNSFTVSIASKFDPRDGGHTSNALFSILVNGRLLGRINNTMNVHKGGSKGHYWGYQTTAVAQRTFSHRLAHGDTLQVIYVSGYLHNSSDIEVSLTN